MIVPFQFFELSDGSYIEASRQFIYDDVVISQENISKEYWLEDDLKFIKHLMSREPKK